MTQKRKTKPRGSNIWSRPLIWLICLAVSGLFFASSSAKLAAQLATADILGTVTDATGAVIPDAKVTLLSTGTGISRSLQSDKTGEFLFSHVQIGTFKVTVEAPGFKNFAASNITASTGERIRINAKLEVGSQVETVSVEASAVAVLQTDTSNIASEISTKAVDDLPLNGRNYYNLIGLQAGVTGGGGGGSPTDARQSMSFSANGQASDFNNNMIDGMDNNERSVGTVAVEPSLDALQEVKVETNLYSAEYSRTGGGIANLITKSGTNQFHGTLFEFMRNDAFDTYDWSNKTSKAELRQNQFGGSIGGPILKNKAFFFGDYQGWRQVNGANATNYVPNNAEYTSVHDYASGSSNSIELADPYGYGSDNVLGDSLVIPGASISKLGLAYLMEAPAPSAGCDNTCPGKNYNWFGNANTIQNANTYDARVDYHFNANNTLFGRWSYNKTTTDSPSSQQGWPAAKLVNGSSKLYTTGLNTGLVTDTNLAFDYVHIFSAKTLFEAKASYLRPNQIGETGNASWSLSDIGINCGTDFCYNSSNVVGIPGLGWGTAQHGLSYDGSPSPYQGAPSHSYGMDGDGGRSGYIENTFQYNAALTMNRKSHSIKAGIGLIRRQINAPVSNHGNYNITPLYTGNELGDLLTGQAASYGNSKTMITPHYRMWEPSVFAQDDWRVTSKLTLNLGVRYDIYTAWTEREGHISNFDLNSDLIVSPSLLGDNQASPTANVNTDYSDISPRIGFAYSLPYNMVLRGGWGLSYFPATTGGRTLYLLQNAPFLSSQGCGSTDSDSTAANVVNCYNTNYVSAGGAAYAVNNHGGYNMSTGMPMMKYDTTLATDTSNYESAFGNMNFMPSNFKNSYLEQFNLQLQKQYKNQIVTAGFVGSLGRRIPSQQNVNKLDYSIRGLAPSEIVYPLDKDGTRTWMDGTAVQESISGANSAWEAGEATYEWHNSYGLNANINYTWARTEGQSANPSSCYLACPMDNGSGTPVTVKGWQAYSYDGSTSHRAAGTITYNLPFGQHLRGPLGAVVKGWALNGTGSWNTGAWTQITTTINNSGIGGGSTYANRVPGVSVKPAHQSLANWINLAAFSAPAANMLGNGHGSYVQEPRSRDADVGLGKNFSVWEKMQLQFRAEAFNVTNTPTYAGSGGGGPGGGGPGGPGGGGSGTFVISGFDPQTGLATNNGNNGVFGDVSSGSGTRIFQFGLKLLF
jgi:hypothetical protein